MVEPIISTRISAPPQARSFTIRRLRLLTKLRKALLGRVTVVSAPAGYGKTTLLADFVASVEVPVAWYSAEPHENEPHKLLDGLLAAIQRCFPTFGINLRSRLSFGGLGADPEPMALAFSKTLAESIDDYLLLVVDDYHVVEESPGGSRFFESLLSELPDNLHVILSTRSWPSLKPLSRMAVNRDCFSLGKSELALTAEEIEELLTRGFGVAVAAELSQEVLALTEGWPAAVVMLGARLQRGGGKSVVGVSPGTEFFEYLNREILDSEPKEVANFLIRTSFLDELTPEICDEVLGFRNSAEMLRRLERSNVLLTPLESDPPAWRYHALLRQFLETEFHYNDPAGWTEAHHRVAAFYADKRQWSEAVRYLGRVSAWEAIVDLLKQIGPGLIPEGRWQTLAECLDVLPRENLAREPVMALTRAKLAYLLGDADTALSLVAQIRSNLGGDQTPELAEALTTRGAALTLKGEYSEAIRSCREALRLLKGKPREHRRADAECYLGIALLMKGDHARSVRHLQAALRYYNRSADKYGGAACHSQLAIAFWQQGHLDEAIYHLEAAKDTWTKLGNESQLVRVLNNLGVAYHWRGDWRSARTFLDQALSLSRRIGIKSTEGFALQSLGDLERDLGNYGRASSHYKGGIEIARDLGDGLLLIGCQTGQADIHRLRGDLESAEIDAKQALLEAMRHENPHEMAMCLALIGQIQREKGQTEEGIKVATEASTLYLDVGAKRDAARTLFQLAAALFALRKRAKAMETLEHVAELATELGYDHFLLSEASREVSLIEYAGSKGISGGYFSKLLARLVQSSGRPARRRRGGGKNPWPVISVRSLGEMSVIANGVQVTDARWQTAKSKEMFLFFLHEDRPLTKECVVTALWPDLPPAKARSYFHAHLHLLRRATYSECVLQRGSTYFLNPDGHFWFDAKEFLAKTDAASSPDLSGQNTEALEQAIKLYQGPFAPDFYSDWIGRIRVAFEDRYLAALSILVKERIHRGDREAACQFAEQIISINPYDGDIWRILIATRASQGMKGLAFRLYRRCCDIFRTELESEPPDDIAVLMNGLAA